MPSNPALDIERDLNPQQVAAVTHGDGPQLVLAGAGSGKTRVITYRIAWLVKECQVDPSNIVAMTFTNKAASEMRERVEGLLDLQPLPTFVGTFHRFALDLLRRHGQHVGVDRGFVIFDSADQLSLVKKALAEENLSESAFPPRSVLGTISSAKNRLLDPKTYASVAGNFYEKQVAKVYGQYQRFLIQSSGVDFDDMLRLAVQLLITEESVRDRLRSRIQHLLVDEFQDTNHAQMRMVQEIVGEAGNLTAVGDEDQGIYRWRGADLDNVLNFEQTFPGAVVRVLEQNYRSTQNILDIAGGLVEHNQRRRGKRLWTEAGEGSKAELYRARDDQDEARWIVNTFEGLRDQMPLREMGILVRTNAQTRVFEEELLKRQIPYELVGGVRFYERAEIKDVVAYLRFLRNPRDNFSLTRILNRPPRGIGKATQEVLVQMSAEHGHCLWDALRLAELGSLPARSGKALKRFRDLIQSLREGMKETPLPVLLERLLDQTGYLALYDKDDPELRAKLENLEELVTAAQEFTEETDWSDEEDLLVAFLDHIALVSDIDGWRHEQGISLMTLHSAKGLEFEAVCVAGLEDGLLPHFNSGGTQDEIEEERRLLYVGMTRAKQRLFLTGCRRRRIAGRYQDQQESPFLLEIPEKNLVITESPELFYNGRTRGAHDFFGRRGAVEIEPEVVTGGTLRRGRRVRHPTLGEGVLMQLEGEGDNAKLTVFFDRSGKRKLVAKYANLELL